MIHNAYSSSRQSFRLQFLSRTSFDPSFRLSWFFSLREKEKDLENKYKFGHMKGCKGTAGGKDCSCKQLQQLLGNEAYEGNRNQYLNFSSEKISGPHRTRNSTQDTDFSYFLPKTSHLHLWNEDSKHQKRSKAFAVPIVCSFLVTRKMTLLFSIFTYGSFCTG